MSRLKIASRGLETQLVRTSGKGQLFGPPGRLSSIDMLQIDGPPSYYAVASLLCDVRREVASAVGIEVGYTEPLEVIRRYEELLSSGVGTAA